MGLIGVDLQTGQARFTFGLPELLDGIKVGDQVTGKLKADAGKYTLTELKPVG